jgi:large-conductance mechanosensitive channel
MDDTPRAFLEEFRSSILKKRVGQIALAVVLAEAVWRLLNAFTWFLIMPIIGGFIQWQNESVLFARSRGPILWENLFGSLLEFLLTIILVFYANRWIHSKARSPEENAEPEYSLVGERLDGTDQPAASETSI